MNTKTLLKEPQNKGERIPRGIPAEAQGIQDQSAKEAMGREYPGIGEIHPLPLEEVISRIEERLDDC